MKKVLSLNCFPYLPDLNKMQNHQMQKSWVLVYELLGVLIFESLKWQLSATQLLIFHKRKYIWFM